MSARRELNRWSTKDSALKHQREYSLHHCKNTPEYTYCPNIASVGSGLNFLARVHKLIANRSRWFVHELNQLTCLWIPKGDLCPWHLRKTQPKGIDRTTRNTEHTCILWKSPHPHGHVIFTCSMCSMQNFTKDNIRVSPTGEGFCVRLVPNTTIYCNLQV